MKHPKTALKTLKLMACTLPVAGLCSAPVQAQPVARVTAVERVTQKRSGAAGQWVKAGVGTTLEADERFRTGKRSKADIKFNDGSLLRLGQLSSVEIRGVGSAELLGGRLLFSTLHPQRILAGTAVGEIKGSVGIIELQEDGSAEFTLFSGAMDVVTPKLTVALPPGRSLRALPDGTLTALSVAAPLNFDNGFSEPELLTKPKQKPFAGSPGQVRVRSHPSRIAAEDTDRKERKEKERREGGGRGKGDKEQEMDDNGNSNNGLASPQSRQVMQPLAVAPESTAPVGGVAATTDVVRDAASGAGMRDADSHLNEGMGGGRIMGGDARFIAGLGDGGTRVAAGRFQAFGAQGHLLWDVAYAPLHLRLRTPAGRQSVNLSAISDASVTYRQRFGDLKIGRQRFLSGPAHAALFGSLVRQGGREIMDAVRFSPNLGSGRQLEVAYLHDAYPRNLPYRFSGAQSGFYARFATYQRFGNFGLNLLKYRNRLIPSSTAFAAVPTTTGATVDFAVPLRQDQIELYGEFGRDTFRRRLTTVGLAFPGFHDRTDFDVYLEYARLGSASGISAPPNELTLRVYRSIQESVSLVGSLGRLSGGETNMSLAVSVGQRFGH